MERHWTRVLPPGICSRIEGYKNFQQILDNAGWLFADKAVRMGVGLFVNVWVARYLGPEQFGLLSYVTAFVGLFATIATLGLDNVVIRDIVHSPQCAGEIIGTAFMLRVIGALTTLLVSVFAISVIRPGEFLTIGLVTIVSASTIFQSLDVIDFWFQSQVASKYTVYARNSAFLIIAAVKVLLILTKAPLVAFVWAILAELAIGAAGLVIAYRRYGIQPGRWQVQKERALRLLRDSWPLVLTGMVIAIYMKIDLIMLGEMSGNGEVGIYAAAVRVSEIWYVIPTVVSSSIYPSLIKAYQDSEEKFYHHLKLAMGYFFWGSLIVSIAITFISNDIMFVLYGNRYQGSGAVLSIHIFTGVITSMSIIFSQKYVIDGTTRVAMLGSIFGAIVNVVLNLWLISRYGAVGAAISTFVSYIAPLIFIGLFVDKKVLLTFIYSPFYVLKRKMA